MSLVYTADIHEYRWKGEVVDSVNQILKAENIIPDFSKFKNMEYKRILGTYVHAAISLYFSRKLDESSLSGDVLSYFNGAKKFIEDSRIIPLEVEKPLYSNKWKFAGTPDMFTSKNYDWKCSQITYPHFSLCMGGYDLLIEEYQGVAPEEHILVKLKPNDYKLETIKPNRNGFLAFLMAWRWRKKHLRSHSA